jgi:hypothetical protein
MQIHYNDLNLKIFKTSKNIAELVVINCPNIIKRKDVQEGEFKKVFGLARGRDGYSFADCYNFQVVEIIKEIYFIVYWKNEVPRSKSIGKELFRALL